MVKNIKDIGRVFLLSQLSDFMSLLQRLDTSCISIMSSSKSFIAFSLSSAGNDSSFDIRFLTTPKTPLSGNISPTVPKIPGADFARN